MEKWIRDLCRRLPKAELHLHIDGALSAGIAMHLAEKSGWRGFARPLSYREMYRRLVVGETTDSQQELLDFFEVPGILLHTEEALRLVTRQLMLEKAADNVRYLELRWAPSLHTREGLGCDRVVEIVQDECERVAAATGQVFRLIVCGIRTLPLETNLAMLEDVAPYIGDKLVAADYAGLEAQSPDALEQEAFFTRARQLGLEITLHCGELPGSAPRILEVVQKLSPVRIAHGLGSIEDPALCALLGERGVMLDICPTSNIQAGLYPGYGSCPLADLIKAGVPVSLNTDCNVLCDITLSDEYINMLGSGQLDLLTLWQLNLSAVSHSFLPEGEKRLLLEEFKRWDSVIANTQ